MYSKLFHKTKLEHNYRLTVWLGLLFCRIIVKCHAVLLLLLTRTIFSDFCPKGINFGD